MEHDGHLDQGEVGPLSERSLVAEVVNMKLLELCPLASLKRIVFHLRLYAKLDEIPDG